MLFHHLHHLPSISSAPCPPTGECAVAFACHRCSRAISYRASCSWHWQCALAVMRQVAPRWHWHAVVGPQYVEPLGPPVHALRELTGACAAPACTHHVCVQARHAHTVGWRVTAACWRTLGEGRQYLRVVLCVAQQLWVCGGCVLLQGWIPTPLLAAGSLWAGATQATEVTQRSHLQAQTVLPTPLLWVWVKGPHARFA
jgi:hypothetical protein